MNKDKGFTLIEALIAILITTLIVISIAGLITVFGAKTTNRILLTCLVEGATSGIEACKGGEVIDQITCGGYTVSLNISGNCQPSPGTCSDITVTASVDENTFSLTDKVCNF